MSFFQVPENIFCRCGSVSTSVTFLCSTNSPTARLSQAPCLLNLQTGFLHNNRALRLYLALGLYKKTPSDCAPSIPTVFFSDTQPSLQEKRIDEFSIHTLRESHATIQELTSQIQERVRYMNDSREFPCIKQICGGNFYTFPVSRQSFQVLDLC